MFIPSASLSKERITSFASHHFRVPANSIAIRLSPLTGGLEAGGVSRVKVAWQGRTESFVTKRITGRCSRELGVYRALQRHSRFALAPALLGAERTGKGERYLYLEWISAWEPWPWGDSDTTALVLELLAYLHSLPSDEIESVRGWDYESDLTDSARAILPVFENAVRRPELAHLRRYRRLLERVVTALPVLRRQMLAAYGSVPLHGDAHPGNAIIRSRKAAKQAVLIDWARARAGSPLEDVCSWLQSLGYWEPEAKRRHDTLLTRYLAARGISTRMGENFRQVYWLAGASNALAGALRYHLSCSADSRLTPKAREQAARAARDWFRILRRAEASWKR